MKSIHAIRITTTALAATLFLAAPAQAASKGELLRKRAEAARASAAQSAALGRQQAARIQATRLASARAEAERKRAEEKEARAHANQVAAIANPTSELATAKIRVRADAVDTAKLENLETRIEGVHAAATGITAADVAERLPALQQQRKGSDVAKVSDGESAARDAFATGVWAAVAAKAGAEMGALPVTAIVGGGGAGGAAVATAAGGVAAAGAVGTAVGTVLNGGFEGRSGLTYGDVAADVVYGTDELSEEEKREVRDEVAAKLLERMREKMRDASVASEGGAGSEENSEETAQDADGGDTSATEEEDGRDGGQAAAPSGDSGDNGDESESENEDDASCSGPAAGDGCNSSDDGEQEEANEEDAPAASKDDGTPNPMSEETSVVPLWAVTDGRLGSSERRQAERQVEMKAGGGFSDPVEEKTGEYVATTREEAKAVDDAIAAAAGGGIDANTERAQSTPLSERQLEAIRIKQGGDVTDPAEGQDTAGSGGAGPIAPSGPGFARSATKAQGIASRVSGAFRATVGAFDAEQIKSQVK